MKQNEYQELAKLEGKECYFFTHSFTDNQYKLITLAGEIKAFIATIINQIAKFL